MKPTTGEVMINNKDILHMTDDEIANFRGRDMGFIFQSYNLIESLTVSENIALPLTLQKTKPAQIKAAVQKVADLLHISEYLNKYPAEL